MDKLEVAKYLLERVGMPAEQQSALCCLSLLAMAKLAKSTILSLSLVTIMEWLMRKTLVRHFASAQCTLSGQLR